MRPIDKLSKVHRKALDLMLSHPGGNAQDLANAMDKSYNTCYGGLHSPVFTDELDRMYAEMWKDSAREAQAKMEYLLNNGKEEIQYKAAEFILKCNNYLTDKIEMNVATDIIRVSIEDD